MLRKLSLVAALAALLIIPATESFARPGGHSGHGGVHAGGARVGIARAPAFRAGYARPAAYGYRPAYRGAYVGRRYASGPRFYPRHRVHGYPRVYGGFYGSCWRWRPTPFGWRRVYVCGYPYAYRWPHRHVW